MNLFSYSNGQKIINWTIQNLLEYFIYCALEYIIAFQIKGKNNITNTNVSAIQV